MSESEIVVQADLGGMNIAFSGKVEDGGSLDERLDVFTKSLGRQRAKISLAEKLVDHLAHQKALASLPDREREMLRNRAEERARIIAQYQAQHSAGNRRGEYKPSQPQQQALNTHDIETQAERKKYSDEKQAHDLTLPIVEAQIARLRAVIAGRDPTEALEIERESLSAAAD